MKQNIFISLKKQQEIGREEHKDPKALIEYLNNMENVYKNTEEYYPDRKREVLIVFDGMISDMISNTKLN